MAIDINVGEEGHECSVMLDNRKGFACYITSRSHEN